MPSSVNKCNDTVLTLENHINTYLSLTITFGTWSWIYWISTHFWKIDFSVCGRRQMHILIFFVPRDSRNNWSRFGWDQYIIIITYITALFSPWQYVCKWALLRRLHTVEFGCIIVRSLPNLKWARWSWQARNW